MSKWIPAQFTNIDVDEVMVKLNVKFKNCKSDSDLKDIESVVTFCGGKILESALRESTDLGYMTILINQETFWQKFKYTIAHDDMTELDD